MSIGIFPSDRGGCGQYRLILPSQAMAANGIDVKELPKPQMLRSGDKVIGFAQKIEPEVLVFQRPARQAYFAAFEFLKSQGKRIVVDMDDDLSCIHPLNPAWVPYNSSTIDMHWQWSLKCCEIADVVVCATEALAEKYGFGHGIVVPNHIQASNLSIERTPDPNRLVRVGWAGLTATHPKDLGVTHGAINQAIAATKGKSKFMALGDSKAFQDLGVRHRAPSEAQNGVPFTAYPRFISQLDIGIVPLEDSEFNRAKSWLKALEYASVGAVPVVSPTPDNMRIVDAGAALAAAGPKDWIEHIKFLIENDEERLALQKRAREFAAEWTIEGNYEKWLNAWRG